MLYPAYTNASPTARQGYYLPACLIVGALRAGWHLLLVLYDAIFWNDALLYSFALQFLIGAAGSGAYLYDW